MGKSSKTIALSAVVLVAMGVCLWGVGSLWNRHTRIQESAANPPSTETTSQPSAAVQQTADPPPSTEQQWLTDNLPNQDFWKGGVDTLDGRQVAQTSEHHTFEIDAPDDQMWKLVVGERIDTTYLPGTREEREGSYLEQTKCSVQFMKVPWRDSTIVEMNVGDADADDGDSSKEYELLIAANNNDINCTTLSQSVGQPSQESKGIHALRLVFSNRHDAEITRLEIIAHTTLVGTRGH